MKWILPSPRWPTTTRLPAQASTAGIATDQCRHEADRGRDVVLDQTAFLTRIGRALTPIAGDTLAARRSGNRSVFNDALLERHPRVRRLASSSPPELCGDASVRMYNR